MRAIPIGMTIALLLFLGAFLSAAGATTQDAMNLAHAPAASETAPAAQKLVGVAAWRTPQAMRPTGMASPISITSAALQAT